tara:strand:- start:1800 stop:2093 length:294 start_codon:yes stop_codon:yes gene_type:complete
MPVYTFRNKKTNHEYDEVMSYDDLQKYLKQDNIEQVFKINIYRYSDNNGIKDQEMGFLRDPKVEGNGAFKPYGKVKEKDENTNYKRTKQAKHFGEKL